MKVSQQLPVIPNRSTGETSPIADAAKPADAAPVAQPEVAGTQRRAKADAFAAESVGVQWPIENPVPVQARESDDHVDVIPLDAHGSQGQVLETDSLVDVVPVRSPAVEKFFKGMGPTIHVVEKGDTLNKIARESYPAIYADEAWVPDNIARANGLENPNLIKVGQELRLPGLYTYTVQSGDTLGKIASISENPLSDIVALNGIENPNLIKVGQEIVLEGPFGQAWSALSDRLWNNVTNVTHTVKSGDTLSRLVREYFPEFTDSPEWIERFVHQFAYTNGLENPDLIHVGQELTVPGRYTYEVQEGDTLWSLSQTVEGWTTNPIRDAKGKPLTTDPKPGDVLHLHLPESH